MREPDNIRAVAGMPIDWMGFIFYAPSPRYAGNLNREVVNAISPDIKKTGVFVNESPAVMLSLVQQYGLQAVQLHGAETPDCCRQLRLHNIEVIKAFSIASASDLQETAAYHSCCDYFLFDTKTPLYGGSGMQYNWSVLDAYHETTPFLLSGGIGAEDVLRIRTFTHPQLAGVDLNSRFETVPGHKDIQQLSLFIESIKKQQ